MTVKELFFGSDSLTPKQENIRELAMYPFAGCFTALANFVSFVIIDMLLQNPVEVTLFGRVFELGLIIKQFVSWTATIITAHTTNRIFVFRSHGNFILELLGFALARLSTFVVIEVALFSFMVYFLENNMGIGKDEVFFTVLSFNCTYLYLVKITNNIVLIIVNFVLSKWVVFRATDKRKGFKEKRNV